MDFLKKRLKRLTSMGLALLLSASAFPATAFAASDSTSTLAEVTAKYIDAENGKEIAEQEIYSVTHEERQPQEIENYTYVDYTENVEYVYSHKDLTYIVGYPDESVRPDASMTRAEATTVFYRLYDGEYPEFERRMSNGTFEDVKTDYWFYKEVETLYNIGIVDGTDEHKFSPDAPVTRAEFAVMAARFANLDYEGGNLFDDVPNGHWAYSYINAAANAGWVEGYPDGSFRPDEPISRAEVVRLVNGMINRNVTLDKLKELGIECPYNDLVENHWGYCDLIEASIPHSAEEWHGLSYNDGIYNIIVEKFIDQNGKELAETVTTAGKEESSPKVIPAYEYRGYIRTIVYQYTNGDAIPSIEKTANAKTANVGDTLTYTVKLTNDEAASSAWKEVVLTDEIPDGLTFADGSVYVESKAAKHSFENGLLSVPLGDIAAGQTVSVTFKATVNSDMYNQTIYNTAVAEGANGIVKDESGSETGKYEDTDDGVYINKGDTAPYVEKRADKPSAEVGDKITYTVTLGNAEGAVYEIENASMTDIIPAELDFVDGSVQVDGVSTGYSFDNETRTLTVPLDRIAPNTKTTVTFAATVNESAYGKTVYNTAVMSGDNISDTEGTDDGVAIGDGKARPSIEKSADKSSAKVGDKITYILTLSNSETATVPVENAAVTDVIPAGLTFEYGSVMLDGSGTSDFTYDENTRLLTVNVGSIEPDTSRTVSFVATVNEDAYNTTIQNLATLTSDNTEPVQDKDDGVVVADGMTDLSINKSVDKSSARVGDTLTYTVQVSNGAGAEVNIRDTVMRDAIPDGLTFRGNVTVDGYSTVYQYDNENRTLSVPLDAIAPGQTKTISFDVLVNSDAYGMMIENTAVASGSNAPDTEDTDDGVTIENGTPDGRAGAKSANKMTARVGDTITYTITLENSAMATADWTGVTVTDATQYTYDKNYNLLKTTDAEGGVSSSAYDALGRVVSATDENGNATTYTYDKNGNVLTETDALSGVVTNTYDTRGRVAATTDKLGATTTYTYDAAGNLRKETDANNAYAVYQYDANNNLIQYTNRNNEWVKYAYDCMNRQVKETNQLNHATEYEYDLAGNQTAVIDGNKNKTIYTYDGLNRLVSKTNAEGGMFEYRYDSFGNTAGTTMYGGGDEKAATTYAYDAAGNLLTETSPLGSVTTYTHDKEGNVLTQVDENGKQTAYTYDKLYRMVSRKDADGTATFAYDKAGNMTSAKDGNGTVAFAFDALSRTTAVTNEDGTTTAYTYDAASNRLSITYPDGKAVTTAYDSLGNVKSQTDHDGTGITYTRDAEGRTIKEGHSDGSTTEYDYNAAGLLTLQKEVTKSNSTRRQTAYTYDDAGNIVSENRSGVDIDKKDELVRYYYDKANQLIRTNIEGKNTKYSYDLAGNLLSDGTNTYTYDLQNRLVSKTGKDGTTTYTYDAAGNLIKKAAPDGTTEYTYTAQNKLKTGKTEDGQSSTYTYNALNVRIKNVQVRDNKNAAHANSDLKDGSHGTDYLDFLKDGRFFWQRTWETEVGTTFQSNFETVTKNYVVDYLSIANRDILVTEDGSFTQRYVYDEDGTRISAEYGYAAGTKRGEGGENLQSDFAANDVRKVWYRTSHLGSTLFAVDETGKVISHTIYDPWGNPLTKTYTDTNFSGIDNANNFTGYTWDEVLDLYFAQNRFYDPADHRFTQEDPIKDGENWYGYCGNNVVNYSDWAGLASSNTRYVATDNVYMRSGAGTSYNVLATLQYNTAVTYLNEKKNNNNYNWAKVQYEGKTGWIADKYLKTSKRPSISATIDSVAQKFGFEYSYGGQYFYSSEYGWQRTFGYMDLFDKYMNIVPGININFLSCIFQYNNKTWRVECWKGEYGPTAGGEVGLYVLDGTMSLSQYFQKMRCDGAVFTGTEAFDRLFSMIKNTEPLSKNVAWYRAAYSSEYIGMSIAFREVVQKKNGGDSYTTNAFASRSSSGHWWLTVFKLNSAKKENIIMDVTLTFPNSTMRSAYDEKLYWKSKYGGYKIMNRKSNNKVESFSWR